MIDCNSRHPTLFPAPLGVLLTPGLHSLVEDEGVAGFFWVTPPGLVTLLGGAGDSRWWINIKLLFQENQNL